MQPAIPNAARYGGRERVFGHLEREELGEVLETARRDDGGGPCSEPGNGPGNRAQEETLEDAARGLRESAGRRRRFPLVLLFGCLDGLRFRSHLGLDLLALRARRLLPRLAGCAAR